MENEQRFGVIKTHSCLLCLKIAATNRNRNDDFEPTTQLFCQLNSDGFQSNYFDKSCPWLIITSTDNVVLEKHISKSLFHFFNHLIVVGQTIYFQTGNEQLST